MLVLFGLVGWGAALASPERGVIRLGAPTQPAETSEAASVAETEAAAEPLTSAGPRRGFDYPAFVSRLESLWFQRKTLLADRRYDDAREQSIRIRDFCAEEGVRRHENLAGALVAEASRYLNDGNYDVALSSLELAEFLDPARAQVPFARAAVLWKGQRGYLGVATELFRGLRLSVAHTLRSLEFLNRLVLILLVALAVGSLVFALLMLARYQVPFRHEIEEWLGQIVDERWGPIAGWSVLLLPLLLWVAVGWAVFYWIVITFRFMRRSERLTAAALLMLGVLALPVYRVAVEIYGLTTDPVFRTTVRSSQGEYDPDTIVELRQLIHDHPDDPTFHFLIGGLYKNGRYFEEAFEAYRKALQLDPAMEQAQTNIGNLFYATGQYGEAIRRYNNALEIRPNSVVALYNLHLAQSEAFRFEEAQLALERARLAGAEELSALMARRSDGEERPGTADASLQLASIWQAALFGQGGSVETVDGEPAQEPAGWQGSLFLNSFSAFSLLALLICGSISVVSRRDQTARRCIRCGRPFCGYCKSGREGHEYCTQCLHLYVRGDGLAPETKTRKMYEVERYQRWTRFGRRLLSFVVPGSGHLLRGLAGRGALLLVIWIAGWIAIRPGALRPLEIAAGFDLRLDLLGAGSVPAIFDPNPTAMFALLMLVVVWIVGNLQPGEA